jgi:hypothetical protein
MNEILLHAGDSANIVVMHSDASTSRVEEQVDETAMMTVIVDANPEIPCGFLTRGIQDEDDDDIPADHGTFEPDRVRANPTRDGSVRMEIPDGDGDSKDMIVLQMTRAEAKELADRITRAAG